MKLSYASHKIAQVTNVFKNADRETLNFFKCIIITVITIVIIIIIDMIFSTKFYREK